MLRAAPGIGPEPVPRRTSFVPFASLSEAFARAAAVSTSSAPAIVGAAAIAAAGAVAIPVSKSRRETSAIAELLLQNARAASYATRIPSAATFRNSAGKQQQRTDRSRFSP